MHLSQRPSLVFHICTGDLTAANIKSVIMHRGTCSLTAAGDGGHVSTGEAHRTTINAST